jgi:RNA recognition motif-containing protein
MSTKVFVGNLAFRTTDQALTEAFGKHGEVKSGVIITRGRRSLGYGFVEFATAEQAAAAVDKMKGAEIAGRQIKVELAKDISDIPEGAEGNEGNEGNDGPAKRRRRAPQDNTGSNASTNTTSTATTPGTGNAGNAGNAGNNANANKQRKGRAKKPRQPGGNNNNAPAGNTGGNTPPASNTSSSSPAEKPARAPRPPREPREKIPSKTTLFVANLPFSVTDAQLLAVFAGTKAKAAHVALTRNGRPRGYGFVEFDSEADQQEALKSHQGKAIDGTNGSRNLSLTISHSVPNPPAPTTPATN